MRPIKLRTELLNNPIGIDAVHPQFCWQIESDQRGARQTAYQIVVGSSTGRDDLWDSGRVESDQSLHMTYGGSPLRSREIAHWTVTIWDQDQQTSSASATFEMGLLGPEDWSAKFIQGPVHGGPRTSAPVPYFRKAIVIKPGLVKARLYATALGTYEAFINADRVGDAELAPGWTDYDKRLRYQVYDVRSHFPEGENTLAAIVGDGWFCGCVEWRGREKYGDRPALLAQLELEYADGSREVVSTDETWRIGQGKILQADLLQGQIEDLRQAQPGWSRNGFDDAKWVHAETREFKTQLVAQSGPVVRAVEEIAAVEVKSIPSWPSHLYVFDLGQNMVGRARIRLKGKAGKTVIIRYAEVLDAKGNMYTENLRSAKQTDMITFAEDGEVVFEPKHTFHGFRYVEIAGLSEAPARDAVTGIVLHSAWEPTIQFECSDPLLNQLHHNIHWGWKGNSVDVPTDCPQRDERLGWTGDAQVFVRTASYHADVATFFRKYVQDLTDAQAENGGIPSVAPATEVVGFDGGPAWSDAYIICPWTAYRCFGDTRVLSENYAGIARWIRFMRDVQTQDGIRSYPGMPGHTGFGDWLSTNAETPRDLIGTAFLAYSARLGAEAASLLGHHEDVEEFRSISETSKAAFNRRYVTDDGLIFPGTQTAYVLALHFDLIPDSLRPKAVQNLVDDIGSRGHHLSTGFVGTPYLAHVLSEGGRLDIAYRLLLQQSWPSWLYSVTQGATTIWERWDGWTHDKGFQDAGMNSFNHYAYGAIGDWIYAHVAGVDMDPAEVAYKKSWLAPKPGGGLTQASVSLETPYGKLSSGWAIDGDAFVWDVTIPPNTSSTLVAPAQATNATLDGQALTTPHSLLAGTYQVRATWNSG